MCPPVGMGAGASSPERVWYIQEGDVKVLIREPEVVPPRVWKHTTILYTTDQHAGPSKYVCDERKPPGRQGKHMNETIALLPWRHAVPPDEVQSGTSRTASDCVSTSTGFATSPGIVIPTPITPGSVAHSDGTCTPCRFHVNSQLTCRNGAACLWCHDDSHVGEKIQRRAPWMLQTEKHRRPAVPFQ